MSFLVEFLARHFHHLADHHSEVPSRIHRDIDTGNGRGHCFVKGSAGADPVSHCRLCRRVNTDVSIDASCETMGVVGNGSNDKLRGQH